MQQDVRSKKRIGRVRFLLEFIAAAVLLKVGANISELFLMVSLGVAGMFLAIWASIRRLRDIKRSEWWVTILIAPWPLAFILGFFGLVGQGGIVDSLLKPISVMYLVVYILYFGVLLLWPSAYPKDNGTTPAEKTPRTDTVKDGW